MLPAQLSEDPADDVELFQAIGRVAVESAGCDRALIWLLQNLVGLSGATWILFQGQSSSWLLETIRDLLKDDPENARSADAGTILATINELSNLYNLRNIVLHGIWALEPYYSDEEDDDPAWRPRSRPWGEWDSGSRKYYCHRTRIRKVPPDQVLTVSDVNRIADEFMANSNRIALTAEHIHGEGIGGTSALRADS